MWDTAMMEIQTDRTIKPLQSHLKWQGKDVPKPKESHKPFQ